MYRVRRVSIFNIIERAGCTRARSVDIGFNGYAFVFQIKRIRTTVDYAGWRFAFSFADYTNRSGHAFVVIHFRTDEGEFLAIVQKKKTEKTPAYRDADVFPSTTVTLFVTTIQVERPATNIAPVKYRRTIA